MKPHLFTSEDPLKLGQNIAMCGSDEQVNEFLDSIEGNINGRRMKEFVEALPRLCWKCRKKALENLDVIPEWVTFKRYLYVGVRQQNGND